MKCGYCDDTEMVYELRSDKGPVKRCIPCLAIEQGQQAFSLPFESYFETGDSIVFDSEEEELEHKKRQYEDARDWYRVLARVRMDDPLIKRDPDDFGTVNDSIRSFLTNIMGADAHKSPSELQESDRDA